MKNKKYYLFSFMIVMALFSNLCIAAEGNKTPQNQITIEQFKTEIQLTKQALQEVRRDQLNYRLEKDLLKEAYSSNLDKINFIITLVLGVFAVIGFMGLRSIASIKKEFQKELDEIKKLRERYENKFSEIKTEQDLAKQKYDELTDVSEKQNNRLKVLEIQDKVSNLIHTKRYSRALEYVSAGLDIEPEDVILLQQKMRSLGGLSHLPEAIEVGKTILGVDRDNITAAVDMAELCLLVKDIPTHESILTDYADKIEKQYPYYLVWYFELFRKYIEGVLEPLVLHIKKMLSKKPTGKQRRMGNWDFTEIRQGINKDKDTIQKRLLIKGIEFLEGGIDATELESALPQAQEGEGQA